MLFFSQAEEAAEIVLGITNGMGTFALSEKIIFDQPREGWEGLLVVLRRAMLWIRTMKGLG
jgi:hypothetical protein